MELHLRDETKAFSHPPFRDQLPFQAACARTGQTASAVPAGLPELWSSPEQCAALLLAGCHDHWFHLRNVTVKKEAAGLVPITLFSRDNKTRWLTFSGTNRLNLYVLRTGEERANHCVGSQGSWAVCVPDQPHTCTTALPTAPGLCTGRTSNLPRNSLFLFPTKENLIVTWCH